MTADQTPADDTLDQYVPLCRCDPDDLALCECYTEDDDDH